MSGEDRFDLVIIGAGPGGYVAAIRAAQLGLNVACVEKEGTLGGTCLNVGCIPSKALLESTEHYHAARKHFRQHGIRLEGVSLDLGAMMARKMRVVKTLTSGIAMLFKKNGVTRVTGTARILEAGRVEVTGLEGEKTTLNTNRILIATGSTVVVPRGIQLDGKRIVSSTEALEFDAVPDRLVIIGAGVIGLELGTVWARLGSKVTLIELLPRILAGFDAELAGTAQKLLQRQGLKFILDARVTRAEVSGDQVEIGYQKDGRAEAVTCDRLLVAVGRRPFTDGLGLDEVGVALDRHGRIEVNDRYETSVPGVFAVGDVIAGPMLAHKAEEEGVAAVEMMAGHAARVNYEAIPAIAYTQPEIASVGATEEALQEQGIPYRRGTFPFQANGRAKAMAQADGWVKVLADSRTDRILGAHIIGPRAGDLIAELALAMEFEGSSEDVARTCHAHPTLAEVVKEACLAVEGRPIHI